MRQLGLQILPAKHCPGVAAGHEPGKHGHQHGAAPSQHPWRVAACGRVGQRDGHQHRPGSQAISTAASRRQAKTKRYKDFVYYSDRMDYLSGMNNNLSYVLAVEKLLGVEI
ncbi:MAG: hypothetical protein R2838_04660 [Caldilineaceae bacterium]